MKFYSFMAFLVLIVADMKCSCLSVLLVYATRRTGNCVALAIYWFLIYVPADVMSASVFARHAVAVSRYTAERQDRAPLQAQSAMQFWLDRKSSYKRLSRLALDLMASPASQAYAERLFSL